MRQDPTVRVAVLPMASRAVLVGVEDRVRAALVKNLDERHYPVVSTTTIDVALKELGFTSGDQLGALKLEEFKLKVPADWYVYGEVQEFAFKSAIAMSQREVALKLRVVGPDGAVLFEGAEKGITTRGGVDAAGDLVLNLGGKVFKGVKDVGKKVVQKGADATGVESISNTTAKLGKVADLADNVADVDLENETREAIRKLLDKLEKK